MEEEVNKSREDTLQRNLDQALTALGALAQKDAESEENLTEFRGTLQEFRETTNGLNGTLQELRGTANGLNGTLQELRVTANELNGTLQEFRGATNEFKGTLQEFRETLNEFRGSIEGFGEHMKELRGNIDDLYKTVARQHESLGDFGRKFGSYTESMVMPSIKKILDKEFDAEFLDGLRCRDLEVDAWGEARNGEAAVYLIEIKSKFRPHKHIGQVWRHVEKFRRYMPSYRDYDVYPMVAAVEISEDGRRDVWNNGIYLIDVADGIFDLAKPPVDLNFMPNGGHGLEGHRRAVPTHLRLVGN